jgi:hypothetical protein
MESSAPSSGALISFMYLGTGVLDVSDVGDGPAELQESDLESLRDDAAKSFKDLRMKSMRFVVLGTRTWAELHFEYTSDTPSSEFGEGNLKIDQLALTSASEGRKFLISYSAFAKRLRVQDQAKVVRSVAASLEVLRAPSGATRSSTSPASSAPAPSPLSPATAPAKAKNTNTLDELVDQTLNGNTNKPSRSNEGATEAADGWAAAQEAELRRRPIPPGMTREDVEQIIGDERAKWDLRPQAIAENIEMMEEQLATADGDLRPTILVGLRRELSKLSNDGDPRVRRYAAQRLGRLRSTGR